MTEAFWAEYNVFLNPLRLISVAVFLIGFHVSIYVWVIISTGNKGLSFFLTYIIHNRVQLIKAFFDEGPGFLVLPLWLIFAAFCEEVAKSL